MDTAGVTRRSALNDDLEAHRRQDAHSQRAALIGLAICLGLVLGGLFLVHALKKSSDLQDCVMQGRTNCAPVDIDDPRR
jgi:hypothetical protein